MTGPSRLVVLVSGSGTNLQAILDACRARPPVLDAEVVAVVSNVADVYALERARAAGVPARVMLHEGRSRREYDKQLAYEISLTGADLVVLAGWNRLLTEVMVAHHTVINLHPAKPGAFPGLGAIEKAYQAWRRGEVTSGGVMVHYVPDEGVDSGPVIAWEEIPFEDGDSLETYRARVHRVEHRILIESIGIALAAGRPLV